MANVRSRSSRSPYTALLSAKRDRQSTLSKRTLAVEAESDRGRLVFSAPFRRLQQKAQVFSLEPNAAVRSRLTHSIEVAQIGRFIADQIVEQLLKDRVLDAPQARAFVTFVEVACLMHDLGNPPFGHFGEAAIAEWFTTEGPKVLTEAARKEGLKLRKTETQKTLADFAEFDGNCQGLRIASILQWNGDSNGLNLTYTSLASYLKYLRSPIFNASENIKNLPFQKKAGFFSTERLLVEKVWHHFKISAHVPRRFPLAFVMEAADDIAYCISDLEDSIEKELLTVDELFSELHEQWMSSHSKRGSKLEQKLSRILCAAADSNSPRISRFTIFRTSLSRALSEAASEEYCSDHASIMSGRTDGLIAASSPGGEMLEMLKEYCRRKVYQHPSIERMELAGLTAVKGLLDHFQCLLLCSRSRFHSALHKKNKDNEGKTILAEKKLLSLFPERHKLAYEHSLNELDSKSVSAREKTLLEWNLRAHLVTDFLSGMTDDFALWSFQMLSGIRTA